MEWNFTNSSGKVLPILYHKLRFSRNISTKTVPPLENEEFVGMWSDREDMKDSSNWVKNLRKNEWNN